MRSWTATPFVVCTFWISGLATVPGRSNPMPVVLSVSRRHVLADGIRNPVEGLALLGPTDAGLLAGKVAGNFAATAAEP